MNFLKLFLRAIALLPSVLQGTEALFWGKDRAAEEGRGAGDRRVGYQHRGRGDDEAYRRFGEVYRGAGYDHRRRGGVFERKPLGQALGRRTDGNATGVHGGNRIIGA
jgi:hypothetical protein